MKKKNPEKPKPLLAKDYPPGPDRHKLLDSIPWRARQSSRHSGRQPEAADASRAPSPFAKVF